MVIVPAETANLEKIVIIQPCDQSFTLTSLFVCDKLKIIMESYTLKLNYR